MLKETDRMMISVLIDTALTGLNSPLPCFSFDACGITNLLDGWMPFCSFFARIQLSKLRWATFTPPKSSSWSEHEHTHIHIIPSYQIFDFISLYISLSLSLHLTYNPLLPNTKDSHSFLSSATDPLYSPTTQSLYHSHSTCPLKKSNL